MLNISVLAAISLITLSPVYSTDMDNKDMNGMIMEGKDGVMGKADMQKMNNMMKDCNKIHNDKKKCDQVVMENCQKTISEKQCENMMK